MSVVVFIFIYCFLPEEALIMTVYVCMLCVCRVFSLLLNINSLFIYIPQAASADIS